jgi:hypothetical protein
LSAFFERGYCSLKLLPQRAALAHQVENATSAPGFSGSVLGIDHPVQSWKKADTWPDAALGEEDASKIQRRIQGKKKPAGAVRSRRGEVSFPDSLDVDSLGITGEGKC